MRRLLLGFGLGNALVYGWRRLTAGESEPEPTWQGTDNDPEDAASLERDLLEGTRASASEPEAAPEAPATSEPRARKSPSS